jgi:hypothetical protein
MNEQSTMVAALKKLGFDSGWVVTEQEILLWENAQPQPTETELAAAGWMKPEGETQE